ncbi:hypothetical protein MP638_005360 [Amoeboaphelidium occidentale]|nr:hypothetical protein MP638_005360 [Amoeboaphelidium occidentale]
MNNCKCCGCRSDWELCQNCLSSQFALVSVSERSAKTNRTVIGGSEYTSARGLMKKHGNKAEGTHACHRAAEKDLKDIVENSNLSHDHVQEIREFSGDIDNLRIQLKEYNQKHTILENELRKNRGKGPNHPVSSVAMNRAVNTMVKSTVDGMTNGKLSSLPGKTVLEHFNGNYDRNGRTALERYHEEYDFRTVGKVPRTAIYEILGIDNSPSPSLRTTGDGRIDQRSSLVRTGDLLMRQDGGVDRRSTAVRNGDVLLRKDGLPDRRSKAFRQGKGC